MTRALRVCSRSGCPNLTTGGRCDEHRAQADRARGTPAQRGYGHRWQTYIQPSYLRRHPFCVVQVDGLCTHIATVADHYPTSRRELIRQRVSDVDADHRLRASCKHCHDVETSRHQPGGWHARQ